MPLRNMKIYGSGKKIYCLFLLKEILECGVSAALKLSYQLYILNLIIIMIAKYSGLQMVMQYRHCHKLYSDRGSCQGTGCLFKSGNPGIVGIRADTDAGDDMKSEL